MADESKSCDKSKRENKNWMYSPKLALYWKFMRLDIVIFCDQPEVTTDIKWINFTLHKFKQYINSVYTQYSVHHLGV